jgi:ABC-2 type transport system ATP-binding protein
MIHVQNITKNYGGVRAVSGVSFTVERDQVLGFLGPNGAGKTTVMKILTGYHFPSGGRAEVEGYSVTEEPVQVKRLTGYLPESVPLYGDMTVGEYLSFMAEARLVPKERRKEAVAKSVEECGLGPKRNSLIDTLSKGYKQRVGLAQAIIHDPPVLILDEPTTGLDPNQIIEIRSLIKEFGRRKTVILSTHILQEVEAVCDKVLILNEGRIAAQGRPEEIGATLKGGDTWELELLGDDVPGKFGRLLSGVTPGIAAEGRLSRLNFFVPSGAALDGERIFDWAVSEGLKILSMRRKTLSLEDIFVKLTGEEGGEK